MKLPKFDKFVLLIVFSMWGICSCTPQKRLAKSIKHHPELLQQKTSDSTRIDTAYVDKFVNFISPKDSAQIKLLVKCHDGSTPTIEEVKNSHGSKAKIKTNFNHGILTMDCKCDTMAIQAKVKVPVITKLRTIRITNAYQVDNGIWKGYKTIAIISSILLLWVLSVYLIKKGLIHF